MNKVVPKATVLPKTLLIIITGLPCTGKTTLGEKLAKELHLPFIYKDGIKETLFDSLGWRDREWSKELGLASIHLLYYFIEALLMGGRSFIVEGNFKAEFATVEFLELKERYNFAPFQILCKTDGEILFQRFKERSESQERHPGHVDHLNHNEFEETLLEGTGEFLDIGGEIFEIDTTNFQKIDYEGLLKAIRAINEYYSPGCF